MRIIHISIVLQENIQCGNPYRARSIKFKARARAHVCVCVCMRACAAPAAQSQGGRMKLFRSIIPGEKEREREREREREAGVYTCTK